FQAEDGIRGFHVTGVQTCALPIFAEGGLYVLGLSWAYAPVSWLGLGVSQNLSLGRSRFIRPVDFTGIAPPEADNLIDTTLETSRSEERRVGKEGGQWTSREAYEEK